jgi:putative DNA primase/helicase
LTNSSKFLKAARAAAKTGFKVFPIRPGSKVPAISGWQKVATGDPREVDRLWAHRPSANIGIATGGEHGLFVLDVDRDEGRQALKTLLRQHESLPPTVLVHTPRGDHHYFCCNERLRNSVSKLGPHLDGRGDGGYVVGAGSVNEDGVRYRYATGHSPDEVEIAEIPGWLLALLRGDPGGGEAPPNPSLGAPRIASLRAAAALQDEVATVRASRKRTRNDRLNTAAFSMGQLIAEGAIGRPEVGAALTAAAQVAGLEEGEIRNTIASGLRAGQAQPRHRNGSSATAVADPLLSELAKLGETDTDNARRLVTRHGASVRFIPERKRWFVFDGEVWRADVAKQQVVFAQDSARLIAGEADLVGDDRRADRRRWAQLSLGAGAIKRALEMAQPHATRSIAEFDTDPWLINAKNGTLDLRSGVLREFNAADHLTRLAGTLYDPKAECVRFKQFLRKVFANDTDLIRFVQRFAGYTLTGEVTEQCFLFLQGPGKNGKSTLIQIMQQMLGDYACSTPTETLLAKHVTSSMSNDLARLQGARMVSAVESNPNRQLDEALIKQVTGGDRITARFLYAEFDEYTPQFKLWFVANHPPRLRSTDDALWRRIHVLPFEVVIANDEVDRDLLTALQSELPGILAWAVRGCHRWQKSGLRPPERVVAATHQYRKEVDHVRRFLHECVEATDSAVTRSSILYERYERWCSEKGEHSVSQKALGKRLVEAGYTPTRLSGGVRAWRGLKVRE